MSAGWTNEGAASAQPSAMACGPSGASSWPALPWLGQLAQRRARWLTWPYRKARHGRFTPCSLSQREAPFVSTRIVNFTRPCPLTPFAVSVMGV